MKLRFKRSVSLVFVIAMLIVSSFSNSVFAGEETYELKAESAGKTYSNGKVYCKFNCSAKVVREYIPTAVDTITFTGTSNSAWTGARPFFANSISQSDTFTVEGADASFSLGSGGAGAGFSSSSNSATLTYPNIVGRFYNHNYTVNSTSHFSISVAMSTTTTYLFGSTTLTDSCTDSEYVVLW
ncbi:MAG: hypothetical protein ABFD25_04950 [Clostridiaceae bacterium]